MEIAKETKMIHGNSFSTLSKQNFTSSLIMIEVPFSNSVTNLLN